MNDRHAAYHYKKNSISGRTPSNWRHETAVEQPCELSTHPFLIIADAIKTDSDFSVNPAICLSINKTRCNTTGYDVTRQ